MMSTDPYSAEVRQLFSAPRHAGCVAAGKSVRRDGPEVKIELSARLDGETVAQIAFLAYGCPHLLAACEAVCETVQGQPVTVLAHFDMRGLQQRLGVPVEKTGRLLLLEDAILALNSAFSGRNV